MTDLETPGRPQIAAELMSVIGFRISDGKYPLWQWTNSRYADSKSEIRILQENIFEGKKEEEKKLLKIVVDGD